MTTNEVSDSSFVNEASITNTAQNHPISKPPEEMPNGFLLTPENIMVKMLSSPSAINPNFPKSSGWNWDQTSEKPEVASAYKNASSYCPECAVDLKCSSLEYLSPEEHKQKAMLIFQDSLNLV